MTIEETIGANGCGDCPICLESLSETENNIYPLPCQTCDYNFCSDCLKNFCSSSRDDFQIASDGSRQVKVSVSCPQCRSKYSLDGLEETVLLLREVHTLASSIMAKSSSSSAELKLLGDSQLSANQLVRKSKFATHDTRSRLDAAYALYEKAIEGGQAKNVENEEGIDDKVKAKIVREEARNLWMTLLDQLSVEYINYADNAHHNSSIDGKSLNGPKSNIVDDTLFQYYDEFINRDEKVFLTDLYTSGDVQKLTQASLIMMGVRQMGVSGRHASVKKEIEEPLSKQEIQKRDQMKLSFPLPNHMPGYFCFVVYTRREGYMTFKNTLWDGSIAPPQRSNRVFEHVYGQTYKPPRKSEEYPISAVVIQAVRGPVGRLGLRKGDLVTHVNDVEWCGSAEDLETYIHNCHANNPHDEISITVNANPETATFLRIRRLLMKRDASEKQRSK